MKSRGSAKHSEGRAEAPPAVTPPSGSGTSYRCPMCGAVCMVDPGFTPWCDRCGWNLWPYLVPPPQGALAMLYAWNDKRSGGHVFEEQLASPTRPHVRVGAMFAGLAALATDALIALFALVGLVLIVFGFPNPLDVLLGLPAVALAVAVRPRFPRQQGPTLSRQDAPQLYALLDEIAGALRAPRISAVVATGEFASSYAQVGLTGRRRVLYLGMPFWTILDEGEKTALLANAVAHGKDGDPTRLWLIGSAVNSMMLMHDYIQPEPMSAEDAAVRDALVSLPTPLQPVAALGFLAGRVAVTLAAKTFLCIAWLILLLVDQATLRAAYAADLAGAGVSGSSSVVSMLEKLGYGPVYQRTLEGTAASPDEWDVLAQLDGSVARTPERQRERLRRIARLEDLRLDPNHPSRGCRIRVLEAHPSGGVWPSAIGMDAIDAELRPAGRRAVAATLSAVEDRLYG